MKVAAPLHKNVLAPLATMEISFCNWWCSLKEIQGRGVLRAGKGSILVIFTEDMGVIIKIIKLQENSGILFDGVSETVKHEIKWQEGGSLDMLIGTLEASKLGDMLTGKGVIRAKKCVARAGRGYNNMDQMEKKLVLRHPLINIEITSISTMNLALMAFFPRDKLPRMKDRAYVRNIDDKQSKRTHWVLLFIDRNTELYLDSFRIWYIPQEILNKMKDKFIRHNIFRI